MKRSNIYKIQQFAKSSALNWTDKNLAYDIFNVQKGK